MSSKRRKPSAIAEPQRDHDLVRLYWPTRLRPAFDALFAIDRAMAEAVANASQPGLAAIKLAWWRDELEKLDRQPPPGEPRLQAVSRELLPRGLAGTEIAGLEEGWAELLRTEAPQAAILCVGKRGPLLFELAARLLALEPSELVRQCGEQFAVADLARRGLSDLAPQPLGRTERAPSRLRPLTMLAAVARRDLERGGPPFEAEASPGRAWVLLRHRLTGR